jgi:HD-GYP domain-containing protein (c-di-GMP phosphodiesterase class II)
MSITAEQIQPRTPLYNSRIIANYVKYTRRNYDHVDTDELFRAAGMESYQVQDEDYWFTQGQVNLFHEALVRLTQNKSIAREAGRFAAASDSSGLVKSYALGFVNPATVCKMASKASAHFTKSCVWVAREISPDSVEITVTPQPGAEESLFQCENRIGYFEAIFAVFRHKLPNIEHSECVFRGDKHCRYVVTWGRLRSAMLARVRNFLALFLCAAAAAVFYFESPEVWAMSMLASSVVLFGLSSKIWDMERKELVAAVGNLRDSSEALFEKVRNSQNRAQLISEVGITLTRQKDASSILVRVAQVLEEGLDYDRGMILLIDKESNSLNFKAGFGYSEEDLAILRNLSFRLRPESRGVFVECFRTQKAFLVNDLDEIKDSLSRHSLEFARQMGAKSFICCPIACADEAIGVLAVDNRNTKRTLLQSDIDLLMLLAPEIGVGFQNALLTELKEKQFHSILQVLASSIDARDPLTSGHSERVTRFATGICQELGLSDEDSEMIRVAASLHDYGKIAIKDSILKKPGTLTPEEFQEIKVHAAKTREILEKIEFEGVFKQVPVIASCHHEKWNGTGYPSGLKFEEIPLGARILAVSDVFEAVTSRRHYRGPMPLDEAFGVLESSKGTHFEPRIVEAFVRYYKKEGKFVDSLPAETNTDQSSKSPREKSHSLQVGLRPRTDTIGV